MNIPPHTDRARQPRSGRRLSPLPPGTRAPAFTLRCGPHCAIALDDFRGRPAVLVFYVADWHPVCGAQLALYQELLPQFERLGAALVGISADSLWSHAAFARAHRLQFPLLADHAPRGAVARAYGVYDRRAGTCRRALFVVDGDGTIRWSASFPDAVNPGADGILTALESLDGAAGRVAAPASVVELPRGPPGGPAGMAGGAAPGIGPGGLEVPVRVQAALDVARWYRVSPDLRATEARIRPARRTEPATAAEESADEESAEGGMLMAQAVLINVFEVPEGRDDEFLAGWEEAKRFMEQQPGYVSTALHRSLDPKARFRYINVAVWERPEDFMAALNHPTFVALRNATPFPHYPSVYTVIRQ